MCSAPCVLVRLNNSDELIIPNGITLLWGSARHISHDHKIVRQGIGFRSRLEADFYDGLSRWVGGIEYEPFTIRIPGDPPVHYTPDFWVPGTSVFLETKGMWSSGGRKKLDRLLEVWPEIPILIIPESVVRGFKHVKAG